MVQIVTSGFANEAIQVSELNDNVADVTEGMSAFKNGKGAEKPEKTPLKRVASQFDSAQTAQNPVS